jgi:hypothetical protein
MAISRFAVIVAASALSSACATTRYTQSRFETVPPGAKGKAGAVASLEVGGLAVRVETLDRAPQKKAATGKETVPPLALRIAFEPRALGYSFDPGQVVLRTADGKEWRAAGAGYELVYPGASFELGFDGAVEPGARVELVLGGLARGPQRLEPVTLRLARREGRSIDRMYWLEAIGYAILAPIAVLTYPYGGM